MQFLKTLFWVILAVIIVIFAANNWETVSIKLWDGLQLDTKLPVLVIGAFLLGFVPLWLFHRAVRWRLNRRIASLESGPEPAGSELDRSQPASERRAPSEPPARSAHQPPPAHSQGPAGAP